MPSRPEGCLLLLLPLALVVGCGPRYVRQTIHDDERVSVVLRAEIRGGERVERHFRHPATISAVRLAHILSRVDVRAAVDQDGGQRRPAIDTSLLFPLGDLLSEALAKAASDQEVVVQARRSEKRLGIFHQEYLTSLVAYVAADDRLVLHLSRLDWPVPKTDTVQIKEPVVGREVMSFRVIGSEAIEPLGPQSVAVEWRDPLFREASNLRVGPTGRVLRRTILMEAAPEAQGEAPAEPAPELVPSDPVALRALAELEEARRAGEITEMEYGRRRRAILRGGAP